MGAALVLVAVVGLVVLGHALWVTRPAAVAAGARRVVDGRRALVLAAAVGFVLRLAWVIWATRAPAPPTDPSEYLRIALELGRGDLPRFGGVGGPSAYWPPGYSTALAPFVWVADKTGWISPAFTAALFNVAAGTVSIVLTGLVAERWLGRPARDVAAWLVALCPALIYFTSTAHTETFFTAVFLTIIVIAGRLAPRASNRAWLLLGVLVGAGFLVRTPAVIAGMVPLLAVVALGGNWRQGLRATGLVVAGAMVLLVPWTIRNGVQVGIWSPASTNNASAACFGHNDGVDAVWENALADEELQIKCFRGSPYDDRRLLPIYEANGGVGDLTPETPDEVRWYREAMADAVHWAVTHPKEELVLSFQKVVVIWGDEGRVVNAARNYSNARWAGRWASPLEAAANLWLWIVGALALASLVLVRACRRATPVWVPIILLTLAIVGGVAEPHYRYPVVPLVAVLASGLLCRRSAEQALAERLAEPVEATA